MIATTILDSSTLSNSLKSKQCSPKKRTLTINELYKLYLDKVQGNKWTMGGNLGSVPCMSRTVWSCASRLVRMAQRYKLSFPTHINSHLQNGGGVETKSAPRWKLGDKLQSCPDFFGPWPLRTTEPLITRPKRLEQATSKALSSYKFLRINMPLHQKTLVPEWHHQENEETTHRKGENVCKSCSWYGTGIQNI